MAQPPMSTCSLAFPLRSPLKLKFLNFQPTQIMANLVTSTIPFGWISKTILLLDALGITLIYREDANSFWTWSQLFRLRKKMLVFMPVIICGIAFFLATHIVLISQISLCGTLTMMVCRAFRITTPGSLEDGLSLT